MNTTSSKTSKPILKAKNYSHNYGSVKKQWNILARINYSFYVDYVHRGLYNHAKHTKYLCDKLEAVERGEIKRLMIFMPPRHSKSMTASETFPSYFIGKNPERRVISVSYGDSLARKFGRMNKQKLEEYGDEVFGVKLSRTQSSSQNWNIEGHRGGMISSGVGGSITGEGADLLMIDDPIKNRQEANSPVYREMVWNEWQNTLRTRLSPNGAVIIILTRWHYDDLVGRILEHEGEQEWEIVSFPAEAEENDILGREVGDPLWEEFGFDKAWIEETKKGVGSLTWTSLYQQRPTKSEGEIIKRGWWKYYDELPSTVDETISSWDCTFKDTDGTDFVVGQVWARKGSEKFLLDEVRARMDLPTTMNAIRGISSKYPEIRTHLIEDKANGSAVIQMLKKEISGLIAVNPEGGKVVRAQSVTPTIEAGNVYIPKPSHKSWVHDFVEECSAFPRGKNDDRVDSMSQALNYLAKRERQYLKVKPHLDGLGKSSSWHL